MAAGGAVLSNDELVGAGLGRERRPVHELGADDGAEAAPQAGRAAGDRDRQGRRLPGMSAPRLTVRARLTALYALLVALSTGVLLLVSYWLLGRHFDRTLPAAARGRRARRGRACSTCSRSPACCCCRRRSAGRWRAACSRRSSGSPAPRGGSPRSASTSASRSTGPNDELRELAETLNSMLDRLAESFDAQRRFVANASHELRSPLTVIRSEAEVALANPDPTSTSCAAWPSPSSRRAAAPRRCSPAC